MGLFSGVASAKNMNGRNPKPKFGRITCLLKKAQYVKPERSNTNFVKIQLQVVCTGVDEHGLEAGDTGYAGNVAGEMVDVCYFEDKDGYFASDIQKFGLAVLNTDTSGIGDGEGQTSVKDFEDHILPDILGIDDRGNPTGVAGMFDNATVLELNTIKKISKPKNEGEAIKTYYNSYFTRRVPIEEATAGMTDLQIVQLFGSMEDYTAAVALDAELF